MQSVKKISAREAYYYRKTRCVACVASLIVGYLETFLMDCVHFIPDVSWETPAPTVVVTVSIRLPL